MNHHIGTHSPSVNMHGGGGSNGSCGTVSTTFHPTQHTDLNFSAHGCIVHPSPNHSVIVNQGASVGMTWHFN